jgi:hypothetical protein
MISISRKHYLHHDLLDQPAVQPLQVAHQFLLGRLRRLLGERRPAEFVIENQGFSLAASENLIVLLDLSGVEGVLVCDHLQVDLLQFEVVLLHEDGGTKQRLMSLSLRSSRSQRAGDSSSSLKTDMSSFFCSFV